MIGSDSGMAQMDPRRRERGRLLVEAVHEYIVGYADRSTLAVHDDPVDGGARGRLGRPVPSQMTVSRRAQTRRRPVI